jgi:hypothetical protein
MDDTNQEEQDINDTKQSDDDLAIFERLNHDDFESDRLNNVKRFREVLAEELVVQLPGITRNRAAFLRYIGSPARSRTSPCTT